MALLNYAKSIQEINTKLSIDVLKITTTDVNNFPKLFFTEDGHIITHGRDYTRLFSSGTSGLVNGSSGLVTEFLRGNNTWGAITVSDLPIWQASDKVGIASKLYTSEQVDQKIKDGFSANDAMRFKGTITKTETGYTATGFPGKFPTKCEVGDTYRVTASGQYAEQYCEAGDLLICIKGGSAGNLNTSAYWTVVQSNINGEVQHTINGAAFNVYSSSTDKFNFYAPKESGTEGQLLQSKGDLTAPAWVNAQSITVGDITAEAKAKLFTALSLSTAGVLSMTIGGTTKSQTASGTWNIGILGNAATATKVNHALSVKGGGLTLSSNFDGSTDTTISLQQATTSNIGGVSIDTGKRSSETTLKPTISVSNGMIFLTAENIKNALGYIPESSANATAYSMILSDSGMNSSSANTANPFLNLIKTAVDGTESVEAFTQFKGSEGLSISSNGTILNFALQIASDSNLGVIKTGYTNSKAPQDYAVKVNTTGQAYVSVPWKNTTYGVVTKSADGLAPKFDASAGTINEGLLVLAANTTSADWYALPNTAFSDTWRPIYFGNTETIGNKSLRILPGNEIYLKTDLEGDNFADISFGLAWYNLSTDKYEMTN